jgi:DNA-binding LacI/PurR family transcriptional regulator
MDTKIFEGLQEKIDRESPIPLYYQIQKEIEQMLESGVLSAGVKIPGDLMLSDMLDVDHRTVRKAYEGLVEKGLITRRKKIGTFINENLHKIFPTVGFYYFVEAESPMLKRAEYMQSYLLKKEFDLKIVGFQKDYYEKFDIIQEVKSRDIKGLIIVPLSSPPCKKALLDLEKTGFPYVRFGNPFFTGELKAPLVRGNEKQRIIDTLKYLWDMGHRKIGLVSSKNNSEIEKEYLNFFSGKNFFRNRWLTTFGFSGPPEQYPQNTGLHFIRGYLETNSELTAVVVQNPGVCMDFLRQAKTAGRKVPENLSLISLSDWKGLEIFSPGITAMHLPEKIMAEAACKFLFKIIERGFSECEEIAMIDSEIIERGSVSAV